MMWTVVELNLSLWAACMLYLYPLKHRSGYGVRLLISIAVVCVISTGGMYLLSGYPLLYTACVVLLCVLFIYLCAAMPINSAVYCAVWAVITQQVAFEVRYVLLGGANMENPVLFAAASLAVFGVVYALAGATIARYLPEDGGYQVGPRKFTSAVFLLVVFELLFDMLRLETAPKVLDVRTWNVLLVQCYCVMILYLQNALFKKSAMKQELDILNQLWHQQKEQYELSRETITLINRKCHDLKHQIAAMRAITSPEEREKYLREVEDSVQIYDSIVKTGNEVLDTVLTEKSLSCAANHIKINCVADGRRMDIMDPVDLYTVFGNAIDNAIESVKQLTNPEMRMIDVLVYVRRQFLMINIMNPIGRELTFNGELPVSTKTRNGYHGFGLKSIRYTVEKYNGFMKIDTEENIFSLKILIPLGGDLKRKYTGSEENS